MRMVNVGIKNTTIISDPYRDLMPRLGGNMERCSIISPFVNLNPGIPDELS